MAASVLARSVFFHAASQRIKTVCQLFCAIQRFLAICSAGATSALLCRLQPISDSIQTSFDCTFLGPTRTLFLALQAFFPFSNSICNTIPRERVRGVF